jgi:hypothetical protein
LTTGLSQPWYTDSIAYFVTGDVWGGSFDSAHYLVTRDEICFGRGKLAIDHMQVRTTDPAVRYLHQYLPVIERGG